jgi:uncharacterized protein DUF2865
MALRGRVALLLGLLALAVQPADAQEPVESIFGYGAASPRVNRYPARPPYGYSSPYGAPFSPYEPYDDADRPLPPGGTYRTLCVRLCDGFYFPVSGAATQGSLARDAEVCSASCDSEARLFYHSNVGGDVDTMVDLTGLAYSLLPNAYKYRKTLVEGCRCRPQPWSEAERARHRAYAEGRQPPQFPARAAAVDAPRDAEVIAGGDKPSSGNPYPLPGMSDDARPIARPPPIVRQDEPALSGWPFLGSDGAVSSRSRYERPDGRRGY